MIVSLLLSLARGRRRRLWATPTYLTVSPTSHDFGMNTGSVEILVDSSSDWTATGVPSDMSLSVTSGSSGETNVTLTRTGYDLDGTAVITFKNEDGDEATLSVTRTKVSVAVLVNASDSSDIHEFDSCEEAATYAKTNSGTNWGLTINGGEVPESCFEFVTNLVSLTLNKGVTNIEKRAFYNCTGLVGSLTIPDSVTSIGERAFYCCQGFTGSLTIGNSVTNIGSNAFFLCNGFTGSLTIPDSVTNIGEYAFYGCSGFTGSLTLPEGLTDIEECAFSGCSGFTGSLTIPDSVTNIGNYAFRYCMFSGSLVIPGSVTGIGSYAFFKCSNFDDDLTFPGTVEPTYGTSVFTSSSFTKCKVPSGYTKDTFCDLPVEKGAVASYFEFADSSLWVDNVTLDAIQDITSNTNWTLE